MPLIIKILACIVSEHLFIEEKSVLFCAVHVKTRMMSISSTIESTQPGRGPSMRWLSSYLIHRYVLSEVLFLAATMTTSGSA